MNTCVVKQSTHNESLTGVQAPAEWVNHLRQANSDGNPQSLMVTPVVQAITKWGIKDETEVEKQEQAVVKMGNEKTETRQDDNSTKTNRKDNP